MLVNDSVLLQPLDGFVVFVLLLELVEDLSRPLDRDDLRLFGEEIYLRGLECLLVILLKILV